MCHLIENYCRSQIIQFCPFPRSNWGRHARPNSNWGRLPSLLEGRMFARTLRGTALTCVKAPVPHIYGLPSKIPTNGCPILVWGRTWVVKESTLAPNIGLGLYATTNIIVPTGCHKSQLPELFPYAGPRYKRGNWLTLARQCPTYKAYGMKLDITPPFYMLDGYLKRTGNLAGYINSLFGIEPQIQPNIEWVESINKPKHPRMKGKCHSYVMTYATQTIHARDELLASYNPWKPTNL